MWRDGRGKLAPVSRASRATSRTQRIAVRRVDVAGESDAVAGERRQPAGAALVVAAPALGVVLRLVVAFRCIARATIVGGDVVFLPELGLFFFLAGDGSRNAGLSHDAHRGVPFTSSGVRVAGSRDG